MMRKNEFPLTLIKIPLLYNRNFQWSSQQSQEYAGLYLFQSTRMLICFFSGFLLIYSCYFCETLGGRRKLCQPQRHPWACRWAKQDGDSLVKMLLCSDTSVQNIHRKRLATQISKRYRPSRRISGTLAMISQMLMFTHCYNFSISLYAMWRFLFILWNLTLRALIWATFAVWSSFTGIGRVV